jgi:hypothetical protein
MIHNNKISDYLVIIVVALRDAIYYTHTVASEAGIAESKELVLYVI